MKLRILQNLNQNQENYQHSGAVGVNTGTTKHGHIPSLLAS